MIFFEDDLPIFCNEEDEITDGSEVDFNDEANMGEGVCTLVSGSIQTAYKDADFVTQYTGGARSASGEEIANRLCCLAYDEDGMINNGYELTFACEEIPFFKETPTYDPDTQTCQVETE